MLTPATSSLLFLVLSGTLAAQTPTVDASGESMRLRSATVQGSGSRFSIRAVVGKRTGVAAVNIAVDLVEERILTKAEAVMKATTTSPARSSGGISTAPPA